MTVIPASSLSRAEMWMLGNNVVPRFAKDRRKRSTGCEAPAGRRQDVRPGSVRLGASSASLMMPRPTTSPG